MANQPLVNQLQLLTAAGRYAYLRKAATAKLLKSILKPAR